MIYSHLPLANIIDNLQAAGQNTGWNTREFIAQCIWIIVLFIVLRAFAWKPVRTILEERRTKIEESVKNADRIKQQLADAEAKRMEILQKANDQAAKIVAEAGKSADALKDRRAQEAARQAEDIVKNAHEAAVLDRNRLMTELKAQIGALVIQTTEKVTGKVLTPADQSRLNDETLRQVESRNN
jgi:F-type H+-transporting ATPase subunit b